MPSFAEGGNIQVHVTHLGQIGIYLGKFYRMFLNEKGWKVFVMAAVVAFIVAGVCNNVFVTMEGTQVGALAFACVCIWNGFFNSIQAVCRERLIIKREHRAGLHITSYVIAHMIYQAGLCLVQTVICIIVYRLCGITYPSNHIVTGSFLLDFGITLFLITYAADMLALCASCIVKTTTAAMTVIPFLMIIQLIFSGVAFTLTGLTDKLSKLTISRWGIRAICTVANHNELPSVSLQSAINRLTTVPQVRDIYWYLHDNEPATWNSIWTELDAASRNNMASKDYLYTAANIRYEWMILILMALLFAAIGTVFLEFIDKDSR